MKKIYFWVFVVVLLSCIMTSCAVNEYASPDITDTEITQNNTDEELRVDTEENTDKNTVELDSASDVQTENTPIETLNEYTSNDTVNALGGGGYPCKIHDTHYHGIPATIVDLIGGTEILHEKFDEYDKDNMSCPLPSIKQVIDEFDITSDEFAEAVRLTYAPYFDLEVLFNGTVEEADKFYENQDWIIFTCHSLTICYMDLVSEIGYRYPDEVKAIDDFRGLSIPELVKLLDIKREDLEEMIKKSSDDGNRVTYNYNLDMLYGPDGEIIFEKPDDVSSYELDEMFCRASRHVE